MAGPQNLRKLSEVFGVSIKQLVGMEMATEINRLSEKGVAYRLNEETGVGDDHPSREKCREYFERFLATCDTRAKLGWLLVQMELHLPLNQFKKSDS